MTADLPDTLQFMQLLWAIVHRLDRRSKRMRTDLGITGPQRLVLRVMGLFPGLSAGDLAGPSCTCIPAPSPVSCSGWGRRVSSCASSIRATAGGLSSG